METQMDYSRFHRIPHGTGCVEFLQARADMQPKPNGASHAKAIAAITLGNGLEFFDFTIYSFFATIIGKLYFPGKGSLRN